MQKRFLLMLCLLISFQGIVQEIGMTAGIGYAMVDERGINNKKLMLGREFRLAAELPIGRNGYCFIFSAGIKKMEAGFTDLSGFPVFNRKEFVNLPLAVKRYYAISKKAVIFLEAGFSAVYFLADRMEIVRNNTVSIQTNKGIGWNMGVSASMRFKVLIGSRLYYDVGFAAGKEWSLHTVSPSDQIRTNWKMLMNSFSLKLR